MEILIPKTIVAEKEKAAEMAKKYVVSPDLVFSKETKRFYIFVEKKAGEVNGSRCRK